MRIGTDHELGDELAIVERCRRDDPEAFGRIVDAYQARVYGFIRRMVHDDEEASDLSQEVFLRAFQSFSRFDGRSSVRTWLFRIAHNLCIDRSRKRARAMPESRLEHLDDEEADLELPDTRWNPETMALDEEFMAVVDQGIASMSDKLRAVLLLHDREDMSYEEIAAALQLPLGTVKSRLFLARAHLHGAIRAYLDQEATRNE